MTQIETSCLDSNDTKVIYRFKYFFKLLKLNKLKGGTKAAIVKVTFNNK
ncbi:hypothetical protein K08M4_41630 [Vibrio syngnathi]|uniref:Uncharacterized protein n=1 Tax=Vibrio syngnathi TaxID=3034029 RepID=A0AA34TTL9_9VIBR|nr:hypothetical protein K08M4_41630 [Vibrio syngnathi]